MLSNQQNRAIQLALSGLSWSKICEEIDITNQTMTVWRKNKEFKDKLTEYQELFFAETCLLNAYYVNQGLKTLLDIGLDETVPPTDRINAIDKLIKSIHKNIEVIKVVERNRAYLDHIKSQKELDQINEESSYEYS